MQEGGDKKMVVGHFEVTVRKERVDVDGEYMKSIEEFRMEPKEEEQIA